MVIVTAVWRRANVFKLFCEWAKTLDLRVIVVGSPHDYCGHLATQFHYIQVPNLPLTKKWNAGVQEARKLGAENVLFLGSDDILGDSLIEVYKKYKNVDYVYITKSYFFDIKTKQGLFWKGYRHKRIYNNAAGIGKMLSAKLLDKMNWEPFSVGQYEDMLDTSMDLKLEKIRPKSMPIDIERNKLFALDIKSSFNMTPFKMWDNCKPVDGKAMLFNNLSFNLAQMIYKCVE